MFLKRMQNPKSKRVHYAMYLAQLTNQELLIIKLWMDGFGHYEIINNLRLKISQPAVCKKIKSIQVRVKRAYDSLDFIGKQL